MMRLLPRSLKVPPRPLTRPVTGANGGSAVVRVEPTPVTVLPVVTTTWPSRLTTGDSTEPDVPVVLGEVPAGGGVLAGVPGVPAAPPIWPEAPVEKAAVSMRGKLVDDPPEEPPVVPKA